jgi:hypothetical protein
MGIGLGLEENRATVLVGGEVFWLQADSKC